MWRSLCTVRLNAIGVPPGGPDRCVCSPPGSPTKRQLEKLERCESELCGSKPDANTCECEYIPVTDLKWLPSDIVGGGRTRERQPNAKRQSYVKVWTFDKVRSEEVLPVPRKVTNPRCVSFGHHHSPTCGLNWTPASNPTSASASDHRSRYLGMRP